MPSASPSNSNPAPGQNPIRRVAIAVRGRPRAGRQCGDLDGRGLLPPQRHRGPGHPPRLCPPRRVRRRPPDAGRPRLHRAGSVASCKRIAEHAGHPDRHGAHQPRQGRVAVPPTCTTPSERPCCRRVHRALDSLGVDALISIGGDDTLKTANKFKRFQEHLPADARRIAVVHVPKTIDNDYRGIDFTFGYFTAVETLASEIRNLLADAEAEPRLLPRRDHGPQRRLARLRRGHCRRGQPGHQRRGPRRRRS